MKKLTNTKLCKYILAAYTFLLFAFVVLKLYRGVGGIISDRNHIIRDRLDGYLNINLIPLKTIKNNFDFKSGLNIPNIFGNIVPYIVLGMFISMSENKFGIVKSCFISFITILLFEIVQFITCTGFFDIDDIILNFFSCLLGIGIVYLYKERKSSTCEEMR